MKIIALLTCVTLSFTCFLGCRHYDRTHHTSKIDSLRKNIVGLWGGLNEDRPVWNIGLDSIYYYQQGKAYKYKLYEDSLVIQFPDHVYSLQGINVIADTLEFHDEVGKIYAYRTKVMIPQENSLKDRTQFDDTLQIAQGKSLFTANCGACHAVFKTDNRLQGVVQRLGVNYLKIYVTKQDSLIKAKDKYALEVKRAFGNMGNSHNFQLSDKQLNAIIAFLNKYSN